MADENNILNSVDLPYDVDSTPTVEAPDESGIISEEKLPESNLSKQEIDKLISMAKSPKYANDEQVQAFVEGLARSSTFGLSDLPLGGLLGKRQVAARKDTAAGTAGELAGIIAPSIASGGTSLLAKGAQTAGKGILTADKTGIAVKNALQKVLQNKVQNKVLQKSLAEATGSGVEAAFYGAGELASETALGRAELNAENLLSTIGTSAAFGTGAGGLFGAASALVPIISKKTGKITGYKNKKVTTEKGIDAAEDSFFPTNAAKTTFRTQNPGLRENLPDYLVNRLGLSRWDGNVKKLEQANIKAKKNIASELTDTVKELDSISKAKGLYKSGDEVVSEVTKKLNNYKNKFIDSTDKDAKKILKIYEDKIKTLEKDFKGKKLNISDLQKQKQLYDDLASHTKEFQKMSAKEKANITVANAFRDSMYASANKLDETLGNSLKKLNDEYRLQLIGAKQLPKLADKKSNAAFLGVKDLLLVTALGGAAGAAVDEPGLGAAALLGKKYFASDLRRRMQVLSSVERANKKVSKKISSGVKNFFEKGKKITIPTSTNILLNTTFSPSGKKPKKETKKQAFQRVKKELTKLVNDPNMLIEHLVKNNLRVTAAAPQTAEQVNEVLIRSINFLQEKMPKNNANLGTVQLLTKDKKFQPSTIDLAKFERYVEGVEKPLSILDDLESGRLSREKIEAVRMVYPDLYARIQQETMQYVSENAESLSYPKRLQLGILLEIPADTSLVPDNMQKLQQTFADEAEQQAAEAQSGAITTTQGGLENLNFAESEMSQTQKISNRK